MVRKIPVWAASSNVVCLVSARQEISLADADRAASMFVQKLKDKHGEQVLRKNHPKAFCFDVLVDQTGQMTSKVPTLNQIDKAKGHWSEHFQIFLRHRN